MQVPGSAVASLVTSTDRHELTFLGKPQILKQISFLMLGMGVGIYVAEMC